MAKTGASARQKGHVFEQRVAKTFRDKGWEEACTSRFESKRVDDSKVDLCFTGIFNVQCKAVETLGSPHNSLKEMPNDSEKINLLWHKRNNKGTIVALTEEDFWKLLADLHKREIALMFPPVPESEYGAGEPLTRETIQKLKEIKLRRMAENGHTD